MQGLVPFPNQVVAVTPPLPEFELPPEVPLVPAGWRGFVPQPLSPRISSVQRAPAAPGSPEWHRAMQRAQGGPGSPRAALRPLHSPRGPTLHDRRPGRAAPAQI